MSLGFRRVCNRTASLAAILAIESRWLWKLTQRSRDAGFIAMTNYAASRGIHPELDG